MKRVKVTVEQEICTLHKEVGEHINTALSKAIRIGELLTGVKQQLKHGEFIPWMKENLPFSLRTAQGYMRLHKHRESIQEAVSIQDALRSISGPKSFTEIKTEPFEVRSNSIKAQLVAYLTEVWRLSPERLQRLDYRVLYRQADALEWDVEAYMEGWGGNQVGWIFPDREGFLWNLQGALVAVAHRTKDVEKPPSEFSEVVDEYTILVEQFHKLRNDMYSLLRKDAIEWIRDNEGKPGLECFKSYALDSGTPNFSWVRAFWVFWWYHIDRRLDRIPKCLDVGRAIMETK